MNKEDRNIIAILFCTAAILGALTCLVSAAILGDMKSIKNSQTTPTPIILIQTPVIIPTATMTTRAEKEEYFFVVKSIIETNRKTLEELDSLSGNYSLMQEGNVKWVEDILSKYNQMVAMSAYAMSLSVPQNNKLQIWEQLRKINAEYVFMRFDAEKYWGENDDNAKVSLDRHTIEVKKLQDNLFEYLSK